MRVLTGVLVVFMLMATACGDDTADDALATDASATSDGSDAPVSDEPVSEDSVPDEPVPDEPVPGTDMTDAAAVPDPDPVSEQQATCDLVADALVVGPDAMSPSDAAQTLADDPEPPPPGILEALESIVALEAGNDSVLEPVEIIDRLVGYYSFCDEITQIDFGLESDAPDATDAATEELGISCFYKFDEAACAQWEFDDPDQGQAPTEILESECAASASRRTLMCAELGVRGFEIDAAHGALNLEIIQAAGRRCEQGIESFANPNLHSVACDYGQISGS